MKKLLLIASLLVSFASFAEDGPNFPYDMNEIVRAQGYDRNKIHPIHDKCRERTRDFGVNVGWNVHGSTPFYGPYNDGPYYGNYWYPASYGRPGYYGPSPAGVAVGAGIAAGVVTGAAVAACCC